MISVKDDDKGNNGGAKRSPKLEPSYLGIYSFAPPSPLMLSPKLPALTPISSTDSLTSPSPTRPKSILRRHRSDRSLQQGREPAAGPDGTGGRPRSVSCVGPESSTKSQFDILPPPFNDDSDLSPRVSRCGDSEIKRHPSFVHFDPTITVRECVGEEGDEVNAQEQESNWFSENELRTFMAETVNLCHSSAITAIKTYSLPSVKKAYETACEAGVKTPILSTTHYEYRALFAEPVLHAADEDAIVHDGSKRFFKILSREMQRVLIVDSSGMTLKLFTRHILSMFPHVHIDTASSGEDALAKIEILPSKRGPGLNYDLIVVEERLQSQDHADGNEDLTGSELLRLINEMEASFYSNGIKHSSRPHSKIAPSNRKCLKVGVSVSLGEDCESLMNKGGADLFWSKPPPKPSHELRNQMMNALLSKRDKSVFICGC